MRSTDYTSSTLVMPSRDFVHPLCDMADIPDWNSKRHSNCNTLILHYLIMINFN